jgi:hypothetical protein
MGVRSLCQEVSKKEAALSGLKGTCSDETVAFTMNFNDIQESPGDTHVNTWQYMIIRVYMDRSMT